MAYVKGKGVPFVLVKLCLSRPIVVEALSNRNPGDGKVVLWSKKKNKANQDPPLTIHFLSRNVSIFPIFHSFYLLHMQYLFKD